MPPASLAHQKEGGYVLRRGQIGKTTGWGHNPASARGSSCPTDVQQLPGAVPTCNLLRVATTTIADAQSWCTARADCAAFSYRGGSGGAYGGDGGNSSTAETVVYFKDATSVFFEVYISSQIVLQRKLFHHPVTGPGIFSVGGLSSAASDGGQQYPSTFPSPLHADTDLAAILDAGLELQSPRPSADGRCGWRRCLALADQGQARPSRDVA